MCFTAPAADRPVTEAQVLALQQASGNAAVQRLLTSGPVTVQRGRGSLLKKAGKVAKVLTGGDPMVLQEVSRLEDDATALLYLDKDVDEAVALELHDRARFLLGTYGPNDARLRNRLDIVVDNLNKILNVVDDETNRAIKDLEDLAGPLKSAPDPMMAKAVHSAALQVDAGVPGHKKNAKVRINQVLATSGAILDTARVGDAKAETEARFLEAGRAERGTEGALKALQTRIAFAEDLGDPPDPSPRALAMMEKKGFRTYAELYDHTFDQDDNPAGLALLDKASYTYFTARRGRLHGAALGVPPAELGGIQAYTKKDFEYANPATSNNAAWIERGFVGYFEEPTDTDEKEAEKKRRVAKREIQTEGATLTAMAVEGLRKLPKWQGAAYRGQGLTKVMFDELFRVQKDNKVVPRTGEITWKTITSVTKRLAITSAFIDSLGDQAEALVTWQLSVTDGRDIEDISLNRAEREVALLPGARFKISNVNVTTPSSLAFGRRVPWSLEVKIDQVS